MKVYVVWTEYQGDEPGLEGVYASRKSAEARRDRIAANARSERGEVVWGDTGPDGESDIEWDVDVHVDEMEVER